MRFLAGIVLAGWLFASPVAAQVPRVGTEATFDVATWNIEQFGGGGGPSDDALQRLNVREVIEEAAIDLWAIQEIADTQDFDLLLSELGPAYAGVLATETSGLRLGYIYRTEVVQNVVVRHILTQFDRAFAGRPPLELSADVVLPDTTMRLSLIVLHMKAFTDADSYRRRVDAANRLKNHLDFLRPSDPIIILGDFNDRLLASIRAGEPSPYAAFVEDSTRYFFPSLALDAAGESTFCGNDQACQSFSAIDHILITDELVPHYVTGSARRFTDLLDAFDGTGGACGGEYVCTTSDHLPVLARFSRAVPNATARETPGAGFAVAPAFPNPFATETTLAVTLARAGLLRVEVFDLLGRRRATLAEGLRAPGTHRLTFDAGALPAGIYLVVIRAGNHRATRRVVRMP